MKTKQKNVNYAFNKLRNVEAKRLHNTTVKQLKISDLSRQHTNNQISGLMMQNRCY